MTNWHLSVFAFSIFALLIQLQTCNKAHGYPQNIRHGYPQCQTCHLSPNGGGLLTDYGRSLSEQVSTWAHEGEGKLLHGLDTPKFIKVGGDTRWVNYTAKSRILGDRSRRFFMQTDMEIAVAPIEKMWLVGTVGKYNEDDKYEHRRHYVLLNLSDQLDFRIGRFIPSLGINQPDHRAPIHPGEGGETYNAEATFSSQYFWLSATALGKARQNVRATEKEGYKLDELSGLSLSGKLLFKTFGFGLYHADGDIDRKTGAYLLAGLGRAYLLFDIRRITPDTGHLQHIFFVQPGYEIYRGVDLYAGAEREEEAYTYKAGLNWFPRPHWQLMLEVERKVSETLYVDGFMVMGHYNL